MLVLVSLSNGLLLVDLAMARVFAILAAMNSKAISRRSFVQSTVVAASALAAGLPEAGAAVRKRKIKLGFDNFAVRDMKWNARLLVDYAEKLRCDTVFITDLELSERLLKARALEPRHLFELMRQKLRIEKQLSEAIAAAP